MELYLPAVNSLKEKRSVIKPILNRLPQKFNVACSEIDHQDVWRSSQIAVVCVSNSSRHVRDVLQSSIDWLESNFPDVLITNQKIEVL
ncbi:MAG: DUF503 domain-containing protein [Anaerolineaceae bacterium]|nr:MAG: DUF503 domain-containing protein [Anaerolineaceae bacterium]